MEFTIVIKIEAAQSLMTVAQLFAGAIAQAKAPEQPTAVWEAKPTPALAEPTPAPAPVQVEPTPTPTPAPAPAPEPVYTVEQIRALALPYFPAHREEIKALLTKLGAVSVSELSPSDYHRFVAMLKQLD